MTDLEQHELLFSNFTHEETEMFESNLETFQLASTLSRNEVELQKSLSWYDGVSVIVGVTIGSGIFASPGPVLAYTGSIGASLLVWIAAGLLAMSGGLCYAELGTMLPQNGGEYTYLNRAFGAFPAFLFSWTGILASRPGSVAIITTICAEYSARLIYTEPPAILTKIFALFIALLLTITNILSTNLTKHVQNVMTILKILSLLLIALASLYLYGNGKGSNNFNRPLFLNSSEIPGHYTLALFSALWAYDGWNNLNTIAGELKDPTKNLPISIVVGTISVTVFYLITNLSYFAVLPSDIIAKSNTIGLEFGKKALGSLGSKIIPVVVIISTLGAANATILSGSRVSFVAAQNNHAPNILAVINQHTGTPQNALIFQAILACFLIIVGDFKSLITMYSLIAWGFYFSAVFALIVLRINEPFEPRPFKVSMAMPIIFCLLSASLLGFSIWEAPLEAAMAILFLGSGLPLYRYGFGYIDQLIMRGLESFANKQVRYELQQDLEL